MKHFLIKLFISLHCFSFVVGKNAITYTLSQGRFGDHILAFSKALYLSHIYNIPIVYTPFKYSCGLAMHTSSLFSTRKKYYRSVFVTPYTDIKRQTNKNVLYIAHLGTKKDELKNLDSMYDCMILDKQFEKSLKQMLAPTVEIQKLPVCTDVITVALHVRKGGGFDKPLLSKKLQLNPEYKPSLSTLFEHSDKRWPHKFPSDQYYVDQLIFLSEMLDDQPLYVYLFTDDPHPKKLARQYAKAVNKNNITFDYRNEENHHSMNVLHDYYNMAQYDCLIRAASNFSRAVQLLGNHKIILSVKHADWFDNVLIVDRVGCIIRNDEKNIYLRKSIHTLKPNIPLLNHIKKECLECFSRS